MIFVGIRGRFGGHVLPHRIFGEFTTKRKIFGVGAREILPGFLACMRNNPTACWIPGSGCC